MDAKQTEMGKHKTQQLFCRCRIFLPWNCQSFSFSSLYDNLHENLTFSWIFLFFLVLGRNCWETWVDVNHLNSSKFFGFATQLLISVAMREKKRWNFHTFSIIVLLQKQQILLWIHHGHKFSLLSIFPPRLGEN